MKKTTKVLALLLCAVLLVVGSVMGTLAYLTSQDQVVNTFTVGDVEIKLDEAKVDTNGQPVEGAERVDANEYHLLPGMTYAKDPTVWVKEGSEPAYIRMLVTFTNYAELKEVFGENPFLPQNYVAGWDSAAWVTTNVISEDTANNTATYEFRYYNIYSVAADDDDGTDDYYNLPALFTSITLPGAELDNADMAKLEGLKITVVAQAIQAAGFADADAAWTAFVGQN